VADQENPWRKGPAASGADVLGNGRRDRPWGADAACPPHALFESPDSLPENHSPTSGKAVARRALLGGGALGVAALSSGVARAEVDERRGEVRAPDRPC
jgi:hypothetical protein